MKIKRILLTILGIAFILASGMWLLGGISVLFTGALFPDIAGFSDLILCLIIWGIFLLLLEAGSLLGFLGLLMLKKVWPSQEVYFQEAFLQDGLSQEEPLQEGFSQVESLREEFLQDMKQRIEEKPSTKKEKMKPGRIARIVIGIYLILTSITVVFAVLRYSPDGIAANDIAGLLLLFGVGLVMIFKKGGSRKLAGQNAPSVDPRTKRNHCPICGCRLDYFKEKVINGVVCSHCAQYCSLPLAARVEEIEENKKINEQRFRQFTKTGELKESLREQVHIDNNHRYFYAGKGGLTLVCAFEEVESYWEETMGARTVVKSRGAVSRAVIGEMLGGTTGAIVGAATGDQEVKTVGGTRVIHIEAQMFFGKKRISVFDPPNGLTRFLDYCIEARKASLLAKREAEIAQWKKEQEVASVPDELAKWKSLLDEGAITQEEFDAVKARLLRL